MTKKISFWKSRLFSPHRCSSIRQIFLYRRPKLRPKTFNLFIIKVKTSTACGCVNVQKFHLVACALRRFALRNKKEIDLRSQKFTSAKNLKFYRVGASWLIDRWLFQQITSMMKPAMSFYADPPSRNGKTKSSLDVVPTEPPKLGKSRTSFLRSNLFAWHCRVKMFW